MFRYRNIVLFVLNSRQRLCGGPGASNICSLNTMTTPVGISVQNGNTEVPVTTSVLKQDDPEVGRQVDDQKGDARLYGAGLVKKTCGRLLALRHPSIYNRVLACNA